MDYVEIVSPLQSAYYAIKTIAESGTLQILDNNAGMKASSKRYTETFLQCEEAMRSLNFIKQQLDNLKLLPKAPKIDAVSQENQEVHVNDIFQEISHIDGELHEKTKIYDRLVEQLRVIREKLDLLRFYSPMIEQGNSENEDLSEISVKSELTSTSPLEMHSLESLPSVTGFVHNESLHRLQNMIWRVTRKNAIMHFGHSAGEHTPFCVFTASPLMVQKIFQIANSFSRSVYQFPSNLNEIENLISSIESEITQTETVCQQAIQSNQEYLSGISSKFWGWLYQVQKEMVVWSSVDFGDFEAAESSVVYKGWVPRRFSSQLPHMMSNATIQSGSPVAIQIRCTPAEQMPDMNPPTFIETSNFTYPFQLLNDSYGIPNYNELNGGAFYCMFPFLFGVMFGDIGHSFFYILLTIVMFAIGPITRKNGGDLGEIGVMIDRMKWLLFFASLSSLYCGFIYNECFGIPINIFGTHYQIDHNSSHTSSYVYKKTDNSIYPFGVDPTWLFKENELIFTNSMKMKLSIVMGMIQMVFGLFLSLINHLKHKKWAEIITVWIPEFMYLVPFFGYLVFLILKKWTIEFEGNPFFPAAQQNNGVNLIQTMIGMILNYGEETPELHLYDGQWGVQKIITIIFFASIPLFLFAKPVLEIIEKHNEKNFSVLEILVMNLIHVIEFCLSALSHTASYLRLWALSLAHSQLSHVIHDELFLIPLNQENPVIRTIATFIGFTMYAGMTVAILLLMEAFSALLHAIRLMWVEFSSKFYGGMGYPFEPLSLNAHLKTAGF